MDNSGMKDVMDDVQYTSPAATRKARTVKTFETEPIRYTVSGPMAFTPGVSADRVEAVA